MLKTLSFIPKILFRLYNVICLAVLLTIFMTGGVGLVLASLATVAYGIVGFVIALGLTLLLREPSTLLMRWAKKWDPDFNPSNVVSNVAEAAKKTANVATNGGGDLNDIEAALRGKSAPGDSGWTKK